MAQTTVSISAAVVMITAAVLAAPLSAVAGGAEAPSSASGAMGMPGCQTSCGNVGVPYPFGIGAGCYHSPGFNLTCDESSDPPRLLLGEEDNTLRVLEIRLWSSTVRVVRTGAIINASSHGHNVTSDARFRVPGGKQSPYQLSSGNELVLTGCNAVAVLLDDGPVGNNVISGCASFCESMGPSAPTRVHDQATGGKYCSGSGCCQASIYTDQNVTDMGLQFRWLNGYNQRDMSTLPSYVFIAEEGWFDQPSVTDELLNSSHPPSRAALEVPVVLYWTVRHSEANHGSPCKSKHSFSFIDTCTCWFGHDGNPYLPDGCIDVDECEQPEEYGCFGMCTNLPGTFDCRCPPGSHGNYTVPGGCVKSTTVTGLTIGIGVGSGAGAILLIFIALFLTQKLKQKREQMLKQKFFEQNRGRLLQQLVSQRTDIAERMIITLEELEKATNNFDRTRMLGGGGHGTVYKGILSDLHVVAIKKPKKVIQKEIDEFINEIAILSQINHRNVVKLYGCCLETEVPMLVYEFISNGTLYDHLHINEPKSLSWGDRLRIATETAKSLAYLHKIVSIPIIHRDIKSANILLDDNLVAKVADFGASRYVPVDKSGVTTMVQGIRGYLDPMYLYTGRLTEKSDVYSFGVMLIELLTRKKPFSFLSSEGDGLVAHFATLFADGNLSHILDPQVLDSGGTEVEVVAELAIACVKITGEDRPTMRNVELTLEGIQASKRHVLGNAVVEESREDGTTVSGLTSTCLVNKKESSRQYSMEEEFMLSARYPR